MKKNATYILFGILIILLLGYITKEYFGQRELKKAEEGKTIFNFKEDSVNKIEILKKNEKIELGKINNRWMAIAGEKNFPANQDDVANFIAGLKKIRITNIVSNSLNDAAQYKLDDDNKVVVIIKNIDTEIGEITLGKAGSSYETVYAIKEPEKKIIILSGFNPNLLKGDWRDRTVLKFEKNNIQSIRFNYKNQKDSYTVTQKDDTTWVTDNKGKEAVISSSAVETTLDNTFFIIAKTVVDNDQEFVDSKENIIYTVNATEKNIAFGQELENGDRYVKNPDGYVYILDKSIKDGVLLKKDMLLK